MIKGLVRAIGGVLLFLSIGWLVTTTFARDSAVHSSQQQVREALGKVVGDARQCTDAPLLEMIIAGSRLSSVSVDPGEDVTVLVTFYTLFLLPLQSVLVTRSLVDADVECAILS
jgi:hypothetical protein